MSNFDMKRLNMKRLVKHAEAIETMEKAGYVIIKKMQPPPLPEGGKKPLCSFCTKGLTEVKKMIAGPRVVICNECVDLCVEILNDSKVRPLAPRP